MHPNTKVKSRMAAPLSIVMTETMEQEIRRKSWDERKPLTEVMRRLIQLGLDAEAAEV